MNHENVVQRSHTYRKVLPNKVHEVMLQTQVNHMLVMRLAIILLQDATSMPFLSAQHS